MGKTLRLEDLEHHNPDIKELADKDWKHAKTGKNTRTRRSANVIRKFFSGTRTIANHNQSQQGRRKI
jgi:hypothetical protein